MSDDGGGSLSSLTHLYPLTLCIFSLWPMKHHSSFIQIWDQGTLPPSSLALVSFLEFEVKCRSFHFLENNQTKPKKKRKKKEKRKEKWKQQTTLIVRKHKKQHTLLTSPSLLCQGVFLFILGMGINIHSDYILRQLRKPGEIIYRIPQGKVSPALQILTLPWEPVPGISLWVTKERAQMMQSIPVGPWLLLHVPSCPTIHLRSWSEPERAEEEPPGSFTIMTPSVWGVWVLGSGGSRLSLRFIMCCIRVPQKSRTNWI